ncbi:MAG: hypothetical protein U5J95_07265 [Balneolaceae bacterium]|nr:hypothetical protein [Balneolaceae bacterium]
MNQGEVPLVETQAEKPTRDSLARLISDIFNPLFLPPLIFLIIGWKTLASSHIFWVSTGISLLCYTIIPLGIVFSLLNKGYISSLDAPEHYTRKRLFSFCISSSAIGSIILFFVFKDINLFLANLTLIYLLNPIIGLLINLKWKMSIHAASLAMAITILFYFIVMETYFSVTTVFYLSLCMLLLLLAMIWARHHLKVHTFSELLGGTVTGVMLTLLELGLIM